MLFTSLSRHPAGHAKIIAYLVPKRLLDMSPFGFNLDHDFFTEPIYLVRFVNMYFWCVRCRLSHSMVVQLTCNRHENFPAFPAFWGPF